MEQSAKVSTILKCFVDLNLETNEMFPYDIRILKVSLNSNFYLTEEASTLNITVSLNEPSSEGIEEANVIISHLRTSNDDIDMTGFPLQLRWEIGERVKNVTIPIRRDFLEEGDEFFMIGLTNLTNLLPGDHVQANVLVQDTTVLRIVRILAANVNTTTTPTSDPNASTFDSPRDQPSRGDMDTVTGTAGISQIISFTVVEGGQVNITVGLDEPSQYGVEKVDVVLLDSPFVLNDGVTPLISLSTERLEWSIGEQFKTVTVSAASTDFLEGTRRMRLELRNPNSVKFDPTESRTVEIIVVDPPVSRRFTSVNFGNIYRQRGSVITGNDPDHQESEVYLRKITDGQVTNGSSLYWLVEIGTYYVDENNDPFLSESSNYHLWPNYYFGLNENGLPANVSVRITNEGIGSVDYNGITYETGDSFYVVLSRDATTIVLPTNNSLLPSGSLLIQDNITLMEDTFVEARYSFEIVAGLPQFQVIDGVGQSGPHGFQLKTTGNNPYGYPLGTFNLPNYATASEANGNTMAIYSTYSNMRTRFDGAMCTTDFEGGNKVQNIRIKGLILLSQNSLATDYIGHELALDSDFNPICTTSAGSSNGLTWTSVPFEIV